VAWTLWLGHLLLHIEIAIEIGIAIGHRAAVLGMIFCNLVSSVTQPTEHVRHAIQFVLPVLAFRVAQGLWR
jgi:hypothetical protein